MSHDLSLLRSKFDIDFLKSRVTFFDSFRQEKHNGARIIPLMFFCSILFTKTIWLFEIVELTLEVNS